MQGKQSACRPSIFGVQKFPPNIISRPDLHRPRNRVGGFFGVAPHPLCFFLSFVAEERRQKRERREKKEARRETREERREKREERRESREERREKTDERREKRGERREKEREER